MNMKYLYNLLILFAAIGFVSCGEEETLSIDSLNADGNEFYCNQKVKVWMCVNSSDLWHTEYQWSCDGGTLTQPQGLNEMTWKAPSVPGTYRITCEASVGGKKEVRSRSMYVSSYFFEKFEKSSQTAFSFQNAKNSLKKESNGNQYLMVTVNSSTEPTRYIRHAFGDNELQTPFSTRIKMGFDKNIPTTQQIKVGSKTGNAVLEFRWNMRSDLSNNNSYINQIRLLWYPHIPTDGYPSLSGGAQTVEGTTDWNIQLTIQHTDANGKKTTVNEYHNLNTLNIFKNKEYHTVSLGVDEGENMLVYIDGNSVLQSSVIKNLRASKGCEGGMFINNWEIYQLNGVGARNLPELYLDDAYASNSEILK